MLPEHVYLGCTQRQCEISKDIVDNYRTMFESRISAGATEKLRCLENLSISSWSYDMEGHAKKCVERYCELANRTTQQLYKISSPCIDDHHIKEEWKSVGELSKVCSHMQTGTVQDSDFAGDLEDSKSTSGGTLCVFGGHTFVPKSWMCKKQTSVSHSSTESEIISLDAGLRLDGIPALD